ncbi:hypothetical protein Pcinc_013532 [Petrolisthes cinctipes]|uniref:Carbohydrate sulfotransferase n=1 Tax=Petrolisthes cinctipes TaxID=88211 RepID=A0AAE1FYX2_PETCI|nr:hypothetical protein Pcinc_013532 [Petrolisthes cinctipes]
MSLVGSARIIRAIVIFSFIAATFFHFYIGNFHLLPADPQHQEAMAVVAAGEGGGGGKSDPLLSPHHQNPNDLTSSNYYSLMDDWLLQDYVIVNQEIDPSPGSQEEKKLTQGSSSHDNPQHSQNPSSHDNPQHTQTQRRKDNELGLVYGSDTPTRKHINTILTHNTNKKDERKQRSPKDTNNKRKKSDSRTRQHERDEQNSQQETFMVEKDEEGGSKGRNKEISIDGIRKDSNGEEERREESEGVTRREKVSERKDNMTSLYQLLPVLQPSSGAQLAHLDFSDYNRKTRLILRHGMQEMRRRARRLSSGCISRPSLISPAPLHLLWYSNPKSPAPRLLYCPIAHVASEAWTTIFQRQTTEDHQHDYIQAQPLPPPPTNQVMNDGQQRDTTQQHPFPQPKDNRERDAVFRDNLRMIVVRHPVSRIIAAYKEKMTKKDPSKTHISDLQHKIISKYRKNNHQDRNSSQLIPTFPEFVKYILDVTELIKSREEWLTQDRSWRPYWVECNVCAADYNVVVHMETLDSDLKFLSKLTHIATLRKQMKEWEGDFMTDNNTTASSSLGQMEDYLSQLNVHYLHRLRTNYLLDFIFFGYNLEGMIDMAQS